MMQPEQRSSPEPGSEPPERWPAQTGMLTPCLLPMTSVPSSAPSPATTPCRKTVCRRDHQEQTSDPERILRGRYAGGEIDETEYEQRREVLRR